MLDYPVESNVMQVSYDNVWKMHREREAVEKG